MKARSRLEPRAPYAVNDDISVLYELEFNKDVIKPGDNLKFKGVRGTFKFRMVAHNCKTDSTWVDCMDNATGEFRSFRIDKLKSVIRPKKSYRKKLK